MHAASGRGLSPKWGWLLAGPLLLATAGGCTSSKSADAAAVNLPATRPSTLPSADDGGPVVTFTANTAEVAGHYPATQALARTSDPLASTCKPTLERSDPNLVSVEWTCGRQITAATVTMAGDPLTLQSILTGTYQSYLSSVARQQFAVEGHAAADTTAVSAWYLTPAALALVYADGVVTYPLASLTSYLKDPSSL